MPNNRCTNCISAGIACMHLRTKGNQRRMSADRVKSAQNYVAGAVSPSYAPPIDLTASNHMLLEVCHYARDLEERLAEAEAKLRNHSSPKESESPSPDDAGVEYHNPLITSCVNNLFDPYQKHGSKSDASNFVKTAIKHIHHGQVYVLGLQRTEFWTPPSWEICTIKYPPLEFPEPDLLKTLVHIYFEQINPIIGILHRTSFERSLDSKRHLSERAFGEVVLAVCAVASKYSDDRRVFLEEKDSEHSAGWKYFSQIRPTSASFDATKSLLRLQRLALGVLYFSASSTPDECWFHIGVGLRFLHAVAAQHEAWYYNTQLEPLDVELYKRVFWIFVFWETLMSAFKGRVRSVASFKAPLPTPLDDQYWTVSPSKSATIQEQQQLELGNTSSSSKPSIHAFFHPYFKLVDLYVNIQTRVYPVDRREPSNDDIIALDSAVNQWIDAIPVHLKWNPQQENQIFLDQSAVLYASYYHSQILIHRPFITAPGKESPTTISFPSMAICANAARSIGHVLEVQARRGRGVICAASMISILFDAAVILLINVWRLGDSGRSRTDGHDNFDRATADVKNCVMVLRLYERRWRLAGRSCDIIDAMLNLSKHKSKRPREQDEEDQQMQPERPADSPPSLSVGSEGSSPQFVDEQMEALERSLAETTHLFSPATANPSNEHISLDFADTYMGRMPLYATELGSLPVHPQFENSNTPIHPHFAVSREQQSLYQPSSHLDAQFDEVPGTLPLEIVYLAQAALNDPMTPVPRAPAAKAFDVPINPYWEQWSSYLENVGGMSEGLHF
ncbi:hypothetical protein MIND_00560000 [Mycena indigotica]|uniref:Xylanolytic transcriptional activator regulatory domain-containing protein n=1 Tax=Mycena indigotica TaxID=2126181 RepID=A0A8H6T0F4_9AGAR|nr:uncharacterized protein MIND_00560000 [Mycena indigotica]KAF7307647.1 hypothetical protein MIND_00560000 [Mycena indigotica]